MAKPNPDDRRYSEEHEWAQDNGDGTITMGVTDHAQELLTDIVYVELPEMGKKVKYLEPVAVVESVKSVSDVYSPVSGDINQDAFGEGWIAKIKMDDPAELDNLMDAAGYTALIEEEEH